MFSVLFICLYISLYIISTLNLNNQHKTVWAAQAGAKRVYAIEYTDMAAHARRVVQANGVDHIVKVIQGAVEEVELPQEDWDAGILVRQNGDLDEVNGENGKKNQKVVDIILSGECCLLCLSICAYLVCTLLSTSHTHNTQLKPLHHI